MTRPEDVEAADREKRICEALKQYKLRKFSSYRAAARVFNVSHSTLADRAKGIKPRNQAHEDEQILTNEEETELVRWISRLTICGYPPKPYSIREMAEAIRTRRVLGINDVSATYVQYDAIGQKWVLRFLKRHSELASVRPEQIDAARVKESSHAVLQKWFSEIKSIIDD